MKASTLGKKSSFNKSDGTKRYVGMEFVFPLFSLSADMV